MLAKRNRLSRDGVTAVLKNGRTDHGVHMHLKSMPAHGPAFAVVIPKRVVSGAVARNRVRRRIYAALESVVREGYPIHGIVFVKQDISNLSYECVSHEVRSLISQAESRKKRLNHSEN